MNGYVYRELYSSLFLTLQYSSAKSIIPSFLNHQETIHFGMLHVTSKRKRLGWVGLQDFVLCKAEGNVGKRKNYLSGITNSIEGHEVIVYIFNSIFLHHRLFNKLPY